MSSPSVTKPARWRESGVEAAKPRRSTSRVPGLTSLAIRQAGTGTRPPAGVVASSRVLHFFLMSKTLTLRLPPDLAKWLAEAAREGGTSRGRLIRTQLERARESSASQPFMRLAGVVRGPHDLSSRKGFSRK